MAVVQFTTIANTFGVSVEEVRRWSGIAGFPKAEGVDVADLELVNEWLRTEPLTEGVSLPASEQGAGDADKIDDAAGASVGQPKDDLASGAEPRVDGFADGPVISDDSDGVSSRPPEQSAEEDSGPLKGRGGGHLPVPVRHPELGLRCSACKSVPPCRCGALKSGYDGPEDEFDPIVHDELFADFVWLEVRIPFVRNPTANVSRQVGVRMDHHESDIQKTIAGVFEGCVASAAKRSIGKKAGLPVGDLNNAVKYVFEAVHEAAMGEVSGD